jgi:hypothetical protein
MQRISAATSKLLQETEKLLPDRLSSKLVIILVETRLVVEHPSHLERVHKVGMFILLLDQDVWRVEERYTSLLVTVADCLRRTEVNL